jgi:hypothetical protein
MLVKAKQNGRARLPIFEITDRQKENEPSGENLRLTLKVSRRKQHATK